MELVIQIFCLIKYNDLTKIMLIPLKIMFTDTITRRELLYVLFMSYFHWYVYNKYTNMHT